MGQATTSNGRIGQEQSAKSKSLTDRIKELNQTSRAREDVAADILRVIQKMHEQRDPQDGVRREDSSAGIQRGDPIDEPIV